MTDEELAELIARRYREEWKPLYEDILVLLASRKEVYRKEWKEQFLVHVKEWFDKYW